MAARSQASLLCLLFVSFFILLCLRSHPLGLKEIAFWMGRFILILALVTFIVSVVTPYFNTVHLSGSSPAVPQEENERHQEVVRREQQELLSKKANEYNENILKPRQEEKLTKLEERFYKMTGQTWKLTEGYTLGQEVEGQENSADLKDPAETANEEAIRKRKLPERVTKILPQCEQPQPKRVISLPEEPHESEEGVVSIALRCPSGRVYRRRFYKSCSSIVLLDWMMKIGYHPVLYSVCTPMPRCTLKLKENVTLENVGITRHTALNIEEKDPL
ncbi:UBX domain-containing protein 8 isoform X1 [Bufo bufo]|uniref:UBX domain-containing protein 8 isoform X1 n=1 Tax=Bufo bufo TaxID=8384 RepID=UPI001ABE2CE8|nr:UBX domain-containing protein 8 isoform X1 [Bufo bufo]